MIEALHVYLFWWRSFNLIGPVEQKHGHVGDYRVESPMVLGHESAGIVVRVGRKVAGLQPGDRVAMEPGEVSV